MKDARPNKQPSLGDQGWVLIVAAAAGVVLLLAGLVAGAVTISGVAPAGGGVSAWTQAVVQSWLGTAAPTGTTGTAGTAGGAVLWSPQTSLALACELVLLVVLVVLVGVPVLVVVRRARAGREWTDALARVMSRRSDYVGLTAAAVAADTARLGAQEAGEGVPLGRAVLDRAPLFGTYEWSQVWVMGMRAGKTRSVAVPQILAHRGPVVATSNKSDLHDYTAGPRSELGRVWANDPQGVLGGAPTGGHGGGHSSGPGGAGGPGPGWWWDPLSYVSTLERAERLVAIWAASRTAEDTSGIDPYFEPEGRALAASLLVAAARSGELITRLPDWLTGDLPEPGVPDPTEILRAAGFVQMGKDIERLLRLEKGQRDGVYGTAASFFRWLRDPRYVGWVTPSAPSMPGDATAAATATTDRVRFDPDAFVASQDTLYLLSKEGPGSARAITGALVAAVYSAGEDLAEAQGGRLRTPMLFELDEVANVCRWPELPDVYSHAGGRGMVMVAILQAVSQGAQVWGPLGWAKLWSFTNVLVCGRGQNDADALADLSRLVGERQIRDRSISSGTKGHRSSSTSIRSERIFDESDLRSLPTGRAILLASGVRPVLLATLDFTTRPDGWKATASREHHTSERRRVLVDARGLVVDSSVLPSAGVLGQPEIGKNPGLGDSSPR